MKRLVMLMVALMAGQASGQMTGYDMSVVWGFQPFPTGPSLPCNCATWDWTDPFNPAVFCQEDEDCDWCVVEVSLDWDQDGFPEDLKTFTIRSCEGAVIAHVDEDRGPNGTLLIYHDPPPLNRRLPTELWGLQG